MLITQLTQIQILKYNQNNFNSEVKYTIKILDIKKLLYFYFVIFLKVQ